MGIVKEISEEKEEELLEKDQNSFKDNLKKEHGKIET